MVMLFRQLDGTMGAQNPWRVDNQPGAINAPKPGSVGARAMQANSGGPLAAVARRSFEESTVQQQAVQQQALTPKEEKPGTGANRGATGSLGTSSGIGTAGTAEAGLVGSVNTEVQNDDVLLPYQKI